MKTNYLLTLAFEVESKESEFENLPATEVLSALMKRIAGLLELWDGDAFQLMEAVEVDEPVPYKSEAELVAELKEKHGGPWGAHPDYPVSDWRYEAGNYDTVLGYWEWVYHRIEADKENL